MSSPQVSELIHNDRGMNKSLCVKSKPKKLRRIKVINSAKELSTTWADHENYDFPPRHKIKIRKSPSSDSDSGSGGISPPDELPSEDEHSSSMSTDGDDQEVIQEQVFSKSPDRVYEIIKEWGKGSTCEIRWGFNEKQVYDSVGTVTKRTVRRGAVKLRISYKPKDASEGPSGFIYLPQSAKIKIWSIRETKVNRIKSLGEAIESIEEKQNEASESIEVSRDLDPLPRFAQIDPSFSVHVVAIFRSIVSAYPKAKTESEKTSIWHKLLNAPRDSLATIHQNLIRRHSSAKTHKKAGIDEQNSNLSEKERLEQDIDRRSIRSALQAGKANNVRKATRILDNVYRESYLTAEEKSRELKRLHPNGPSPQGTDQELPRIAVVENLEVRLATEKLSRGASPGPTGFSESMLRLLAEDEESCLSLCHMFRDVINGEVSQCVRTRLTRCRMIALAKPNNGIRPVAMGETILKVCGSILLQRHECALKSLFQPIQRGILQKSACESIVHELISEYEAGSTILTVDFKNAYNTPHRTAIEQALFQYPVFKHFLRMFYLEYGQPSDLLFFANSSLYSTIESSSGVRQGSALSSLYFCTLLQGAFKEVADAYPEVTLRAYQDDVTMSSKNEASLEVAFKHFQELTKDLNLEINFHKCEIFQGSKAQHCKVSALRELGVQDCVDTIKVLGGYIGSNKAVERKLLEKLGKHNCLFRRLGCMGPSN